MSINFEQPVNINFEQPVNSEAIEKLREMCGEPIVHDDKTFLYNKLGEISGRLMSELANTAKQPVTVEINGSEDIKTMSDGTQYRITSSGWEKIIK